jgi:hypothetical protein
VNIQNNQESKSTNRHCDRNEGNSGIRRSGICKCLSGRLPG